MSDEEWFGPKRFGYGAGPPIAWQGWALIGAFVAAVAVAGVALMPRHPVLFVALAILLSIPLTIVSAQHTKGGWHWRWGGED